MSSKGHRVMSLIGEGFKETESNDIRNRFYEILKDGVHGMGFSPYLKDQKPGDKISEEQIRERLEIIKPYTKWVRIFSCTEGNELIPKIAQDLGMKTLVGAWIGKDEEINKEEVSNLVKLAHEGYVDIAAVGNEVMLRGDVTEEELIDYINSAKEQLPATVPVGYVDAYYEFCDRPAVTEACDVILANCYPFWEGCSLEHSLLYMKDMYRRAVKAANGKKVIISETGWPSIGSKYWGAIPSMQNAQQYFINSYAWAEEDNVDIFYFSTFDEAWKVEDEGDVGAYWGIWDTYGNLKY